MRLCPDVRRFQRKMGRARKTGRACDHTAIAFRGSTCSSLHRLPLTEPSYGRIMDSEILGDVPSALAIGQAVGCELWLAAHPLASLDRQTASFLRGFHYSHAFALSHP